MGSVVISYVENTSRGGHISKHARVPSFKELAEGFDDFEVIETKEERNNHAPLYSFAEYALESSTARRANNIIRVYCLVWDFDGVPRKLIEELSAGYQELGVSNFWHTTYSHKGDDNNVRARMVVELSRPVQPGEWGPFWARARHLSDLQEIVDNQCKDPCHLYFETIGHDEALYEYHTALCDGPGLDVDAVLEIDIPDEEQHQSFQYEELPEEERADISPALKGHWQKKLDKLCSEIRKCPAGGNWDLRNDRPFGIAVGAPHIIDPDKVFKAVDDAYIYRAKKIESEDPWDLEKGRADYKKAIEDGMSKPWWPKKDEPILDVVQNLTATGFAGRMVLQGGAGRLLREVKSGAWLGYTGRNWQFSEEDATKFCSEVIETLPQEEELLAGRNRELREAYEEMRENPDAEPAELELAEMEADRSQAQIDELYKFYLKLQNGTNLPHARDVYASYYESRTVLTDFDTNPYLINFQNGTLDARTMKLRAHNPDDKLLSVLPTSYSPEAKCPKFLAFLDRITLGDKKKAFLLRLLGYSLMGLTTEQKFFILRGPGSDGKSALLEVVDRVLGPYSSVTQASHFLEAKTGEEHPAWMMALHNRRLVAAEEPGAFRNFNEPLIKAITGGMPLEARMMRENPTNFIPRFTLWFACNNLPKIDNLDHGIWRRIAILDFDAKFVEPGEFRNEPGTFPRDPRFFDSLKGEDAGILALLAREAHAYCLNPVIDWSICADAVADYQEQTHPLGDFYDECCARKDQLENGRGELSTEVRHMLLKSDTPWRVQRGDILRAYENWALGRDHLGKKAFYAAVRMQYPEKVIRGLRVFAGLRLLTSTEKKLLKGSGANPN